MNLPNWMASSLVGVGAYLFGGYYSEMMAKARRRKTVNGRHWRTAVIKSIQVFHDHNRRIEVIPSFPPKKNRTIRFTI